jgi:hypothetical protein
MWLVRREVTMSRSRAIGSFIALAGLAAAPVALAQETTIRFEVSSDYGDTWQDSIRVIAGQRVDVRMRVELTTPPVGQTVLGLAGLTCQPTLSNWFPAIGDTRHPFTFEGANSLDCPCTESAYNGRHVVDGLGVTGRIYPFGSGGQGHTSGSGILTSFNDPENRLRFAGSKWVSFTTAVQWGVSNAQNPLTLATNGRFNPSRYVTVFKYAVSIGRSVEERTMIASQMMLNGHIVKWYLNASGTSVLNSNDVAIIPATVTVEARCPADIYGGSVPDPAGLTGLFIHNVPDGSVTIDDLLYFLTKFEEGASDANVDNGSGQGIPDQAVTIDDLLFFLAHFELGC